MEHSNTIDLCVKTSKLLPTKKIPEFLNNIVSDFITQEGKKELHKIIASPLCINTSDSIGSFITSEFNHDGDSYRSPWSNEYFPTTEGHKLLPNELRELEVRLNKLVKLYTKLYYGEQAISSTYIWEQGDAISSGFNCAVLIKNNIDKKKGIINSSLDSINVINVKFIKERDKTTERIKAVYKIYTTMLYEVNFGKFANCGFSGNVSKLGEESAYPSTHLDYDTHCENIGKIVENMENYLRSSLDEIYMKKTDEIIAKMRNTFIIGRQNNIQRENLKSFFNVFEKKVPSKKIDMEEDILN